MEPKVLGEYYFLTRRPEVEELADDMARAEKSDPFVRDRVVSHIKNGVGVDARRKTYCYGVDFFREERQTLGGGSRMVEVPKNMKRP